MLLRALVFLEMERELGSVLEREILRRSEREAKDREQMEREQKERERVAKEQEESCPSLASSE